MNGIDELYKNSNTISKEMALSLRSWALDSK